MKRFCKLFPICTILFLLICSHAFAQTTCGTNITYTITKTREDSDTIRFRRTNESKTATWNKDACGNLFKNKSSIKYVWFDSVIEINSSATFRDFIYVEEMHLQNVIIANALITSSNQFNNYFRNCSKLRVLDLSGWNVSSIKYMDYMFRDCTNLEELNLSGWDTSSAVNPVSTFLDCNKLKTLTLGENTINVNNNIFSTLPSKVYDAEWQKTDQPEMILGNHKLFTEFDPETMPGKWTTEIQVATPEITTQPEDLTLTYGYSSGSLRVEATISDSSTLSYQWYSNTTESTEGAAPVENATDPTYTYPSGESVSPAKYYYCVVTSSTGTTAVSNIVSVTVGPKSVTLSGTLNADKTYDGTTDASFDTSGVTFEGKLDGDELGLSLTGTYSEANVGTWDVTINPDSYQLTGTKAQNYIITSLPSEWSSLKATITPAEIPSVAIQIDAPQGNIVLDTTASSSTANITLSDGGKVTWDPSGDTEGKAAFKTDYTATVTVTPKNSNYCFTESTTATVNGSPAVTHPNEDEPEKMMTISYQFPNTGSETGTCAGKNIRWTKIDDNSISFTNNRGDGPQLWNRDCGELFKGDSNITKVYIDEPIQIHMQYAFRDFKYVEEMHISKFIPVSDSSTGEYLMSGAFKGCENLEILDAHDMDVSDITSMFETFKGCTSLTTLDLSGWDIESLILTPHMFADCTNLETLDLSGWDISNVVDMEAMFDGCKNFKNIILGEGTDWDTSHVKNMAFMFSGCESMTDETLADFNISNWNTSALTSTSNMFQGCSSLEILDLGRWNTSGVKTMVDMFKDCTSLKELDISGWNTSNLDKYSPLVFSGCNSLTTLTLGENSIKKDIFYNLPTRGETWFYVKAADPAIPSPPNIGDDLPGPTLLAPSTYQYNSMGGTWSAIGAKNVVKTYDGNAYGIEVLTPGLVNPEIKYGTTEGTYDKDTSPTITNVSEIPLTVYYQVKSDNHEPITGHATVTINPAPITITADNMTKVYDNDETTDPELTATVTGKPEKGTAPVYSLSRVSGQEARDYEITVTAGSNPNYTVTVNNGTFKITKAAITIKAENKTKVYDNDSSTDPNLTVTMTGIPAKGVPPVYRLSRAEGQTVGKYEISVTAEAESNPNYTVTVEKGTFSITKAAVTIKADNKTKIYDNDLSTDPVLTATVAKPANGVAPVYNLHRVPGQDAKDYLIYITWAESSNPNYEITDEDGIFSITKAPITIKADNKTKTYDNDPSTDPALTATVAGIPEKGVKVDYGLYCHHDQNVNNYEINIVATGATNKNYEIKIEKGTFSITPAAVTITADDKTKVYDKDSSTDPNPTATITGKPEKGAGLIYILRRDPGQDVGTYAITVTTEEGANPNYAVTLVNGTFRITPKAVIVKADNKSKVYGTDDPTLTWSVEGLASGDDKSVLTVEISREPGQDVRDYTITTSGDAEQGNYTVSYQTGTFTITNAGMAVRADDVEVPYDGEPHGIKVIVTGPSDYVVMYGTVEGEYTESTSPEITSAGDSPLIVYYQVTAKNYDPVTGSATVKINKVPSSVIKPPTANDRIYDKTEKPLLNPDGEASGGTFYYAIGDDPDNAPSVENFTPAIPTAGLPGTYYVWYKVKGDADHNDTAPERITVTVTELITITVAAVGDGRVSAVVQKSVPKEGDEPKIIVVGPTGKPVELTAEPNPGNEFKGWKVLAGDIVIGSDNKFTIGTEDVFILAVFEKSGETCQVKVNVKAGENGSASIVQAPDGVPTLTAKPNVGYRFREWRFITGAVTVVDDKTFIIGNGEADLQAVFERAVPPEPGPGPKGMDFFLLEGELPLTGITAAKGAVRPLSVSYKPVKMELQIPGLNVVSEIVSVPVTEEGYAVEGLGMDAGLLEGSALPGEGVSVIAGHNTLNAEEYGPFAAILQLKSGDHFFVRDRGGRLMTYEVYGNQKIGSHDVKALEEAAVMYENTLTLLTCEDERPEGGYASRRIVSARLMGE